MISNKIDNMIILFNKIKKIYNNLDQKSDISYNLDEHDELIQKITTDIKLLQKFDNIVDIFNIYNNIILFKNIIHKYKNINHDVYLIYKKYKLTNKSAVINLYFFNIIKKTINLNELKNKTTLQEFLSELQSIIQKNINCIKLYVLIIQYLLEHIEDNSDIYKSIEIIKSYILLHNLPDTNNVSQLYENNPQLSLFKLLSISNLYSIDKVFEQISKKFINKIKTVSDIKKFAIANNFIVIIINQVISNPIIFDINNILSTVLKNKSGSSSDDTNDLTGVNNKIINKFNSIKYESLGKGKKWNFNIEYYGDINNESNKVIVLENVTNSLYKIYYNTVKYFNYLINQCDIDELLTFIKNKNTYKKYTVISELNRCNENIIIDNIFLPIKYDMIELKEKSQVTSPCLFAFNISNEILKALDNFIIDKYQDYVSIKNTYIISEIVHNDIIIDTFNTILLNQYQSILYFNDNLFNISEMSHTFLANIYKLNIEFRRILHDFFVKINISSSIFEKDNINKKNIIMELFKNIIEDTVNYIILQENNFYTKFIYKNIILNIN